MRQKKKKVFLLSAIVLFLVPFFWFDHQKLDTGGDSSRLYFFDPSSWARNIPFYSTNSLNAFGTENPNFMMIPFLYFLIGLKKIVGSPYLLNCFFSGLLLSGGFSFVYLSLMELLETKEESLKITVSLFGGLFFALSPLYIYDWQKALYSFNQVAVYPLIFYLFLKSIKQKDHLYWLLALPVTLIFSVNFSYPTFPWFLPFFFFTFLFLGIYSLKTKKGRFFLKSLLYFIPLFLCLQAFHLFPQLSNLTNPANPNSQAIFSRALSQSRGESYFLSVRSLVRLTYNLLNQPQFMVFTNKAMYDFGYRFRFLYFAYPLLVMAAGMILIGKKDYDGKIYRLMAIIFLFLVLLMSGGIVSPLTTVYQRLFSLPGFSIFRSFFTKFALTTAFFYSLLIGYSFFIVLKSLPFKAGRKILIIFFFLLVIFNGWPLVSGKIVNSTLSNYINVGIPNKFDRQYLDFLDLVKGQSLDGKYLSFPLTYEEYQVVGGESGGAYFGPSVLAILAGKNDFCGLGTFRNFKNQILEALTDGNLDLLSAYFSNFNIRYLFYNQDDFLFSNFPDYPFQEWRPIFPQPEEEKQLIKNLGFRPLAEKGDYQLLIKEDNWLPHFFLPEKIVVADGEGEILPLVYPQIKTASTLFLFKKQNLEQWDSWRNLALGEIPADKPFSISETNISSEGTTLEYKKISPVKYRLRIHRAKDLVPLVFLDDYNPGWRLYLEKFYFPNQTLLSEELKKKSFPVKPEDIFDQASAEELGKFLKEGKVSGLSASSQISFVSKNFSGTVQNNNLENGPWWETWSFAKKSLPLNAPLFKVNGYAGSWIINPKDICQKSGFCFANADGSFDLEIVLEFWPQRFFYLGAAVSLFTFWLILALILFRWQRRWRKI